MECFFLFPWVRWFCSRILKSWSDFLAVEILSYFNVQQRGAMDRSFVKRNQVMNPYKFSIDSVTDTCMGIHRIAHYLEIAADL